MTTLRDDDKRAKCQRCSKSFVLHTYTKGEDRNYCFTCRQQLALLNCSECNRRLTTLMNKQSGGSFSMHEMFCDVHNPLLNEETI